MCGGKAATARANVNSPSCAAQTCNDGNFLSNFFAVLAQIPTFALTLFLLCISLVAHLKGSVTSFPPRLISTSIWLIGLRF